MQDAAALCSLCPGSSCSLSLGELILQQDHGLSLLGATQVAGLSAHQALPCVVCAAVRGVLMHPDGEYGDPFCILPRVSA